MAEYFRLFDEATPEVRERLRLVASAYGELAHYYDLYEAVANRGLLNRSVILDPGPDGPSLVLEGGLIPRQLGKSVPNDVHLDAKSGKGLVLSGPNGEGKSTYIRMLAQNLLLSQLTGRSAAHKMVHTPLRILAFKLPEDNLLEGISGFHAELLGLKKQIWDPAEKTPLSIVFLDEASTRTIPPIGEDWLEILLDELSEKGVLVVASTHHWGTVSSHEAHTGPTSLAEKKPGYFRNAHVAKFQVVPGIPPDLNAMYEGAAELVRKTGWPERMAQRLLEKGRERQRRLLPPPQK